LFAKGKNTTDDNNYNLWDVRLDPDTGACDRTPRQLTHEDGHNWMLEGASDDGRYMAVRKGHLYANVFVADLRDAGTRLENPRRVTSDGGYDYTVGWLPGNKDLLFTSDRSGWGQIYRQSLSQDKAQIISPNSKEETDGAVMPDGKWILYLAEPRERGPSGQPDQTILRAPLSGGAGQSLMQVSPGDANLHLSCPTRAGRPCVIGRMQKEELVFYELDPVEGQGAELARTDVGKPSAWMVWNLSHDGTQIAISGSEKLEKKIRIIDLQNHTEKDLTSPVGVEGLCWSFDGRGLYVTGQTDQFMLLWIDLTGKSKILANKGRVPWYITPVASPDGHMLAYTEQFQEGNAFLLEHF
jgi:hypothetical protein